MRFFAVLMSFEKLIFEGKIRVLILDCNYKVHTIVIILALR